MADYRVALVDDHPLFRNALAEVLRSAGTIGELEIIEASSLDDLMGKLEGGLETDLILLDLGLPGLHGPLGLLALRSAYPTIPAIVVSARSEPSVVGRCLFLGASAFIPKSSSRQQIREAVRAVLSGDKWTPPGFDADFAGGAEQRHRLAALCSLSPRELQVCMALGKGLLNKQIAHQLDIAEATVKAHVSRILEKLNATSRLQAVVMLQQINDQATPQDEIAALTLS